MKKNSRTSSLASILLIACVLELASAQTYAQVAENDFTYNIGGSGFNGAVNASALQADGKLIVGGAFTSFNGKVNSSGSVVTTTRNYIARLNTDGTLDNTFDPGTGLGAAVLSLAIQPSDGKIIVGGSFAAGVARLNTTGTVDGTFALTGTGLNGYVQMVALQTDEKVIIGGTFTTYNTSTTRNRIARLNTSGTLDTGFDPGTGLNGLPRACAIQSDGKIIVVGGSSGFSSYNGTSRDNIVRVESNGTIDNTFVPPANLLAYLFDVKIQSDGKSVITGRYNGNINSIFNGVARLNTNGAIDNTFTPVFFTGGLALAIQSDGKIVIGGIGFGTSGLTQGIRRLTTAGVSDSFMVGPSKGFEPPADSEIRTIAIQSDGRIITGGTGFTSFNGIGRTTIARITTCSSVSITTQPTSATTCATNNATFAVVASGTGLTYKWQVNSAALGVGLYTDITDAGVYTGATTTTLNITGATVGMNGYYYRCLVSDGACTTTSFSTTLTVHPTPVINTPPTDKTKCNNEIPTFTVAGTNLSTFQWQEDRGTGFTNLANGSANGVGYSGVTTATLSVLGPSVSYTGYKYRCIVGPLSGSCSPSVISSEAALTITASPVVTTQPVTGSVCNAGNAVFQVAATGSGLTYQWQVKVPAGSFTNISNGGIYSGALTSQLTLTGATISENNNQYLCIITGSNTCSATSNAVVLSIYNPPSISTHPANSTKCAGTNTTFTVVVTSPPAGLTYQWQEKVGSGSFTNMTNGGVYSTVTAATLTLTGVTAGMNGNKYRCVVGTCATPVVSFEADLIVDSPPVITLPPVFSTICAGMSTTFITNATGLGVTFQWQKNTGSGSGTFNNVVNGGIYSGATTAALTLTNVSIGETNFHYRCVITASGICTGVNTSGALLTVRAVPEFSTQPVNKTVCEGLTTSFSTSVIFSGAPNYQWQVSEAASAFTDLTANVSLYPNGVNSSSLAVSPTFSMNGNKYRVRVGDCQPLVFSNEVTLTVNQAPAITAQPINKTICKGETATFSVTATGSDLTYQWVGPIGGNTSTWTLNNVPPSLTGSKIYCIVRGATGCAQVQSTEATLTVNNLVITTQPTAVNPFCPGGNVSYSIVGEGASLTYQWQEDNKSGTFTDITNGGMYAGATTNKLDLTSVPFTMSGYKYRCVVKGSCGELNSNPVNLSLFPTPAKPIIIVSTSNPEAPVLTASGEGFKWYKNGTLVSSSSSLTATGEGSYTVIITSNGCESAASEAVAIVITGDQENILKSSIQVYPNPASDRITFSLGGFEKDKPVYISIVDMQGRVMEKTSGLGQREVSIDIRSYAGGKYIAWLQQRTTKVARQFIKTEK
jgi:uncharacterized delta-60 repeat protein